MINHIELLIGTIILSFGIYYVSYKIFNMKIKAFSFFNLSIVLIYSLIMTFLNIIAYDSIFKVICNVLLVGIMNQMIFKQEILKTIISSFITIGIIAVSEILYVILLTLLSQLSIEQMKIKYFLHILTNIGITSLMLIIINIKILLNKTHKLLGTVCTNRKIGIIVWSICSILCLTLLLYYIYYHVSPLNALLICLFLTGCYTCLPLILFKEKSDKFKLQSEYNATLKDLNDYEKMLDIQRMKNHENDNNLSAIRGLVDPKNKNAIEFIDSITKKVKNDNKDIILKTKNIPSGGLQGLIYQKVLFMEQKKYHYSLEISRDIKKLKLKKLKTEDIKDICTITGVFIDNAIQAVQNYKKKLVGIYLYKENDSLVISISNNFKGNIEIEKFAEKKYTTKETGHGYGLSLVKEILEKNNNIINEKIFNGKIFSQTIKVKLK